MAVPHGSITFVKAHRMNVQARNRRQTLPSSLKGLDLRIGFEYCGKLGTYLSTNTLRGIHSARTIVAIEDTERGVVGIGFEVNAAQCQMQDERRLFDVLSALQVLAVVAVAEFGKFSICEGEGPVEELGDVGTRKAVLTEFQV